MGGVSGVGESVPAPDGVGCGEVGYVGLGGAHEGPPVLNGVGVSQDQTLDGMDAHEFNQPLEEKSTYYTCGTIKAHPLNTDLVPVCSA